MKVSITVTRVSKIDYVSKNCMKMLYNSPFSRNGDGKMRIGNIITINVIFCSRICHIGSIVSLTAFIIPIIVHHISTIII